MSRLAGWLALGVLAAAALALGAFTAEAPPSLIPSVENRDPRGLAVLYQWLGEDARVDALRSPLTTLPDDVASVVLAAPAAGELTFEEVEALARFVADGGTLVYLAPRERRQVALEGWLKLTAGRPLSSSALETAEGVDRLGATVSTTAQRGLTQGVHQLRLGAGPTIALDTEGATEMAAPGALWLRPFGRGEIWAAAGPELGENARLDLLDNATFWVNLAKRGPIAFDEHHQRAVSEAGAHLDLTALVLQLTLCTLVLVAARGSRLGPPREEPPSPHRSTLEYVRAMASLTRSARIDPELVSALKERGLQLLRERTGLSEWREAVARLAPGDPLTARFATDLFAARQLLPASVALASLERRLVGALDPALPSNP